MPRYSDGEEPEQSDQEILGKFGQKLLGRFERELCTAKQRSDSEQMKLVFKKYYSLPQQPSTTVALVVRYYELCPEVAGEDEFLKCNVLSIPGIREAVASGLPHQSDQVRLGQKSYESASDVLTRDRIVLSDSKDRRAMVKAYKEEVLRETGKRITKKDIWKKAGYKTRTEFERWERHDPNRPNKAADETFTRILCVEKPHLK